MVFANGADAEHYSCGSFSDFFDGYNTTSTGPQTIQGAFAKLVVRRGSVCDTQYGQGNFSIAWPMVAENPGNKGYAQSGYFRSYGTSIQSFTEYNLHGGDGNQTRQFWGVVNPGELHTYWVDYSSIENCERLIVDAVEKACTNFNPYSVWAQPFVAEFNGETRWVESDMPGSNASGWATFKSIYTQHTDNNWYDQTSGLYSTIDSSHTCSCYHQDAPVYHSDIHEAFDIWTDPVSR